MDMNFISFAFEFCSTMKTKAWTGKKINEDDTILNTEFTNQSVIL